MIEFSQGTVERILGRHDDTIVTVSRHGGSNSHGSSTSGSSSSHVSINSRREYSLAFELGGRTYKFTDHDHVILETGDKVRLVWRQRVDGLRQVQAIANESRGITRLKKFPLDHTVFLAVFSTVFIGIATSVLTNLFDRKPNLSGPRLILDSPITILGVSLLVLIWASLAFKAISGRSHARAVNALLLSGGAVGSVSR